MSHISLGFETEFMLQTDPKEAKKRGSVKVSGTITLSLELVLGEEKEETDSVLLDDQQSEASLEEGDFLPSSDAPNADVPSRHGRCSQYIPAASPNVSSLRLSRHDGSAVRPNVRTPHRPDPVPGVLHHVYTVGATSSPSRRVAFRPGSRWSRW